MCCSTLWKTADFLNKSSYLFGAVSLSNSSDLYFTVYARNSSYTETLHCENIIGFLGSKPPFCLWSKLFIYELGFGNEGIFHIISLNQSVARCFCVDLVISFSAWALRGYKSCLCRWSRVTSSEQWNAAVILYRHLPRWPWMLLAEVIQAIDGRNHPEEPIHHIKIYIYIWTLHEWQIFLLKWVVIITASNMSPE